MRPKTTQLETIKALLLAGTQVNSIMAFECYYITRLAVIIKRLRDKGYPIITTRQGNGIADYSLPANWQPRQ